MDLQKFVKKTRHILCPDKAEICSMRIDFCREPIA